MTLCCNMICKARHPKTPNYSAMPANRAMEEHPHDLASTDHPIDAVVKPMRRLGFDAKWRSSSRVHARASSGSKHGRTREQQAAAPAQPNVKQDEPSNTGTSTTAAIPITARATRPASSYPLTILVVLAAIQALIHPAAAHLPDTPTALEHASALALRAVGRRNTRIRPARSRRCYWTRPSDAGLKRRCSCRARLELMYKRRRLRRPEPPPT